MNTILHLSNGVLSYHRGKQVGLWGLTGVALAILVVAMWGDFIQPVVEFTQLDHTADKMGLVEEGAPYKTAFDIFIVFIFASILFSIIVIISLFVAVWGRMFIQMNAFAILLVAIMVILFSPVLLVYAVGSLFTGIKKDQAYKENSNLLVEEKRLAINKKVTDKLLKRSDGKSNEIGKEMALNYLNKFPSDTETNMLIGMTYKRDIVLLFPRPIGVHIYGTLSDLVGVKLSIENYDQPFHNPSKVWVHEPQDLYVRYEEKEERFRLNDIETFIYSKTIPDIEMCSNLLLKKKFYKEYSSRVYDHYNVHSR